CALDEEMHRRDPNLWLWTDWPAAYQRSEERRVGKEGRSRWSPDHLKKNKESRVLGWPPLEGRGPRVFRICRLPKSPDIFQAEDGRRDWSVTGVQTCALPI